jgi:hypothetical protein
VEQGSITASATAVATAASAAEPPKRSMSTPAATAAGWDAATMPRSAQTKERREEKINEINDAGILLPFSDKVHPFPVLLHQHICKALNFSTKVNLDVWGRNCDRAI